MIFTNISSTCLLSIFTTRMSTHERLSSSTVHGAWNNVCHIAMLWKICCIIKQAQQPSPHSLKTQVINKIRGKESWWLTLLFSVTSCDLWEGGPWHFVVNELRQQIICGSHWVPSISITQKFQQNIQKELTQKGSKALHTIFVDSGIF